MRVLVAKYAPNEHKTVYIKVDKNLKSFSMRYNYPAKYVNGTNINIVINNHKLELYGK